MRYNKYTQFYVLRHVALRCISLFRLISACSSVSVQSLLPRIEHVDRLPLFRYQIDNILNVCIKLIFVAINIP